MTNQPYVKEYNDQGELTNPIKGSFPTADPNNSRSNRRAIKSNSRFKGNKKGISLTVGRKFKYRREVQLIGSKRIEHYILN